MKSSPDYDPSRCNAFVNDLTVDKLSSNISGKVDVISAIFVLSAIPPQKLHDVLLNLKSVLKQNGTVIFRDYGFYDTAQLRFKPENKLDRGFYCRTDGTFSVFFTKEGISEAFCKAGFKVLECGYVEKEVVNRGSDVKMNRVFVQGRFTVI